MQLSVDIESRADRWRFRCPEGHVSWEPTNDHFWCARCASDPNAEAAFDALYDKRQDRWLERDQVRLLDSVAPYDRDRSE
ncbi:MAG: hypothetical protein ABEJ86_00940 [Halococcoides sp.]